MIAINPINVNTTGISNGYVYGQAPQAKPQKEEAKPQEGTAQQSTVKPDDVFSYMANNAGALVGAAAAKGTQTINPADYLDAAAQARIAGYVAGFEDKVATGMDAVGKELPNMSDGAKMAVVLNQIND